MICKFLILVAAFACIAFCITIEGEVNDWKKKIYNNEFPNVKPVTAEDIQNCGNPEHDQFVLTKLELTPNPPRRGEPLKIELEGEVKSTISHGSHVSVKVKYGFITVVNKRADLCKELENYPSLHQCPIEAGSYKESQTVEIPSEAPAGRYTAELRGVTQHSKPLFCFKAEFRL